MIRNLAIGALALGLAGSGVTAITQTRKAARLEAQAIALRAAIAGCEARARNLTEDKESDDAVDRIPDAGLRDVPDHWLRPGPD